MNELYERFRTAFRATGYVTDDQSCELAEIAVKISNRSRHVTTTLKLDTSIMQGMIDAVEKGLASVVGPRHAAAAVGKVPFEPNTHQVAADYYNALWTAQDTRLHAWQYKGHYLFAHDRAEAASLMSWKLDHDGPMLALEDFYRVCEAALDTAQRWPMDVSDFDCPLRVLLERSREQQDEAMYVCPIPLPAVGARINSSLGPGHVASAEDKDGYRAVVNQLDSGGTELCAHNWSYIPEEYVWSDDFGRGEMQKLSRKEWLEQYTCPIRPWPRSPDGKPLVEDNVNFPGKARPFIVLDEPWIRHDGGPCPVRHEEVLVYTRSQYDAAHQFTRAIAKRCMPESVNWHWGPLSTPTTPNDVLQWRRVK